MVNSRTMEWMMHLGDIPEMIPSLPPAFPHKIVWCMKLATLRERVTVEQV